ncbi:MAG: methyltransferase [Flavobacteriia bacterium]|nr:MAG: methyltransferase [Flavobacteriia bacterium]
MSFLKEEIDRYAVAHTEEEPKLLQELSKETWQKVLIPRMLSGHYQGRLLAMISKLVQPKNILEIGTYTGYSALCLAEGLQKEGFLHTIDHNEELTAFSKKYFDRSDYKDQIKTYLGEAVDIIDKMDIKFDLVFIDADKVNYSRYFHMIIDKMNKGGVILSDNVLWSGKVTREAAPQDKDTLALQAYNKLLKEDPRIETILLPVRDGLTISRVK